MTYESRDLKSLYLAHKTLLGGEPEPSQVRLYQSFPSFRGMSSAALDAVVFDAALIMAIVQTYPRKERPTPYPVIFFLRGDVQKWALLQLEATSRKMFAKLKEEKAVKLAQHLGEFLKSIKVGSPSLQMKDPPDRWVSFGFKNDDPVPAWLGVSLLEEMPK